jgi:hypothetical protein
MHGTSFIVDEHMMKPAMAFRSSVDDPIKTEFDCDQNLAVSPREDQILDPLQENRQRINMTVVRETENADRQGYTLIVKAEFVWWKKVVFLEVACQTNEAVVKVYTKWKASESLLEWAIASKGLRFTRQEVQMIRGAGVSKDMYDKLSDTVPYSPRKIIAELQMGGCESIFHRAIEEGVYFTPLQLTFARNSGVCQDTIRNLIVETRHSSDRLVEDLENDSMVEFVDVALRRRQKFTVDELQRVQVRLPTYSIRKLLNRNLKFSKSEEVVRALALGCERACLERAARQNIKFTPRQLAEINMRGLDSKSVRSLYSWYNKEMQDGDWVLRHTFSLKTVRDLFEHRTYSVSGRFLEQVMRINIRGRHGVSKLHATQVIIWLINNGQMDLDEQTLKPWLDQSRTISLAVERLRRRMVGHLMFRPELQRCLSCSDCWRLVLVKLSFYDIRNLWRAVHPLPKPNNLRHNT